MINRWVLDDIQIEPRLFKHIKTSLQREIDILKANKNQSQANRTRIGVPDAMSFMPVKWNTDEPIQFVLRRVNSIHMLLTIS